MPHRPLTRFTQLCKCLWLASLVGLSLGVEAPGAAELARQDGSRLDRPGSDEQALREIDQQLVQRPTDLRLGFQRGLLLAALRREAEALDVFQRIARDHPTMAPAFNNIGAMHAALADFGAAKAAFEMAIRVDPENTTAYQNLGDLHLQLAVVSYERLAQLGRPGVTSSAKLERLRELQRPAAPADAAVRVAAAPAPPSQPATAPPAGAATGVAMTPVAFGPAADAEISRTVQAWAQAWSRRDLATYLGHYQPGFSGRSSSHRAWKQQRTRRILKRSHIEVALSELEVRIEGHEAMVSFVQHYDSDGPREVNRKLLRLSFSDAGAWQIAGEWVDSGRGDAGRTQRAATGPNRPTAAASRSSARDRLARASTH